MPLFLADFASIFQSVYDFVWEHAGAFPWLVALLLAAGIFITFRMGWITPPSWHAFNVIRGQLRQSRGRGRHQPLPGADHRAVGHGGHRQHRRRGHRHPLRRPGRAVLDVGHGASSAWPSSTPSARWPCTTAAFDDEGNAWPAGPCTTSRRAWARGWKPLAVLFACCAIVCSFGTGNMNQANTVAGRADDHFGIPTWLVGLVIAGLVGTGHPGRHQAHRRGDLPARPVHGGHLRGRRPCHPRAATPTRSRRLRSIFRERLHPAAELGGTARASSA